MFLNLAELLSECFTQFVHLKDHKILALYLVADQLDLENLVEAQLAHDWELLGTRMVKLPLQIFA